jgi:hypothetical protein
MVETLPEMWMNVKITTHLRRKEGAKEGAVSR